jgi:hypothetical protein
MNLQSRANHVELAVPKGHALSKQKLRLRDLIDVPFRAGKTPPFYDRLMHDCFRGGLKSPRIVQDRASAGRHSLP